MKLKNIINSLGLLAIVLILTSCNNQKRQNNLHTELDSVSYVLGMDVSRSIKNVSEINDLAFLDAFENSEDSTKVKLNKEDIRKILTSFYGKLKEKNINKANDSTLVETPEEVNTNETEELLNETDSVSYALGLDIAYKIKSIFEDIDTSLFSQGYKEEADSLKVLIKTKNLNGIVRPFILKRQEEAYKEQLNEDFGHVKEAGIKFLNENKNKEGVITTESGLQYEILREGIGNRPSSTDNITVHYHGTTPEGTVFDSSIDKGEPVSFELSQMIKGWIEGLQLMKEGAKYRFVIPQELAYGANPRGGIIKPFMPLIFEVELIKINK